MNVLLLSMPDSFEHMPPIVVRMPNGALSSLAGNLDPHHRVAIADLILVQSRVIPTIERLMREWQPDVVGLSVMTFQRATAFKIARLVRYLRPSTRIVVGGYDPSLAPASYEPCGDVDFLVRGEGEQTLCELLRALDAGGPVRVNRGPVVSNPERFRSWAGPNDCQPQIESTPLTQPCGACPRRLYACWGARWMSSRPRGAAPSTAVFARSSKCAVVTSTCIRSSECSPTSRTRGAGARGRSFWSMTTLRSTYTASSRCAKRSSMPVSTTSSISFRR